MKQKKSKHYIIIILLLCAIAAFVLFFWFSQKEDKSSNAGLAYESNVIVDDEENLQDAVDKLFEKAKEGHMALEMQTEAHSTDGKHFTCHLANSSMNNYDMFMVFYRDDTQEEIYRTGLIPIGARIEEFSLEKELEAGNHEITIVYNQVESDRETIHSQVNVGLTLIVKK